MTRDADALIALYPALAAPATKAQRQALHRFGIQELPKTLTMADAMVLIEAEVNKRQAQQEGANDLERPQPRTT